RRVPASCRDHPEQGRQPGPAQHHARRGAALRVWLGLSRAPHPADEPRRNRCLRAGRHHDDPRRRDEWLSQLLARPGIGGDARRDRGRSADLGGRARRDDRGAGAAGLRRFGAQHPHAARPVRDRHPDVRAPEIRRAGVMPRGFSGEIPVERRFPLHLEPAIGSIRDLYDTAKQSRWDPERDIPWSGFDPSRYGPEVLAAARLSWSRKAWTEYGGLPETPALIIRFCLERERESDPKYFLTVRNTEEAWHLECCHRFAESCGGYIAEPANSRYRELFNQGLHREALDASRHLDAYVAAHIGIQDGLDLELTRLHRDNAADPVARAILDRLVADKTRHAAFGWFYLERRAE